MGKGGRFATLAAAQLLTPEAAAARPLIPGVAGWLLILYFLTLGRQTEMAPGFSHRQIWAALDALAERHGLSASGLARKAGLDPTTFNPSKRASPGGRQRWPSTESIAKALAATGEGPGEFLARAGKRDGVGARRRVPAIGLAEAAKDGSFDAAGRPAGPAWAEIGFLAGLDDACYALKISGGGLAPLFRDGELLIVSPTRRRGGATAWSPGP